jgi:MoaA/NifB/PqqE/SkfB family radical SAM enzyme
MRNTLRRSADPAAFLKAAIRTARYHALDYLHMLKPLKLRIGLTNRCNSKCIMCNIWQQEDNEAPFLPHELRVDEIDRILAENSRFFSNLNHISLTGGEPTLRRDFVEIFEVIHKHYPDMNVSFNSNGFGTGKILRYVERILAFHPRLTVMISVDGVGETHDTVRGVAGVYAGVMATLEGVAALRAHHKHLKTELNYVLTSVSAGDVVQILEFCQRHGIEFNPIFPVQGELYFNEDEDNVSLSRDARAAYLEHFCRLVDQDHSLQTREILEQLIGQPRNFDCWAGRIMFLIEENGTVFPNGGCPSTYAMGNLRDFDYSMEALLASDQAQKVLGIARKCRLCRISCETMTTLQHPEALAGYRKSREIPMITEEARELLGQIGPLASRETVGVSR